MRYISKESFSFFLFLYFISVLLSQLPKNNDAWFYLFPVSGIECPMCSNVPGSGAGTCDSGKVPKVNCSDGLDVCVGLKGKMTVLGFTQSIELKNCSNSDFCYPFSDFNGKKSNEFARPPLSQIPPPPGKLHVGDVGRFFMVQNVLILVSVIVSVLDVNAIFCPYTSSSW